MNHQPTHLQQTLESGRFAVTAEIGPPMSGNGDKVRSKARALAGLVDAANVTDNQTAIVRMCSLVGAYLTSGEGVEPILQMTCRDRNRLAIQSDLLGAYALGLRNVLVLSGDHTSIGNHPGAKGVDDLDPIVVLRGLRDFEEKGVFMGGSALKDPVAFYLGATADPFAQPPQRQLERLAAKIDAGARFIQTQGVYDADGFEAWMAQVRGLGLHKRAHFLAGIIVNRSARGIEAAARVPGIKIPQWMIDRMKASDNPERQGIDTALELIARMKKIEGIAGVHIMAIGWEAAVPQIIAEAGLGPKG